MKYFVFDNERDGTCYHEFFKGKWDHTFWKPDSISLDDDLLSHGFIEAIHEVIPSYNPYAITEVSQSQWKDIGEIISQKDKYSQELYKEADNWLKNVFQTFDCFTILGI